MESPIEPKGPDLLTLTERSFADLLEVLQIKVPAGLSYDVDAKLLRFSQQFKLLADQCRRISGQAY